MSPDSQKIAWHSEADVSYYGIRIISDTNAHHLDDCPIHEGIKPKLDILAIQGDFLGGHNSAMRSRTLRICSQVKACPDGHGLKWRGLTRR